VDRNPAVGQISGCAQVESSATATASKPRYILNARDTVANYIEYAVAVRRWPIRRIAVWNRADYRENSGLAVNNG